MYVCMYDLYVCMYVYTYDLHIRVYVRTYISATNDRFCTNRNTKMSVTVGVVGYPNVGKSSLINSLVRTRAVETGAQAGITKVAQEVHCKIWIML
jgi:ribosome biogenesis GTPase A